MSACPIGCGRAVALGNLMCAPCWRLVPSELQRPVWVAWRQLNNARAKGWAQRHIEKLEREHAEAKQKAIAHVKARISQRELALEFPSTPDTRHSARGRA